MNQRGPNIKLTPDACRQYVRKLKAAADLGDATAIAALLDLNAKGVLDDLGYTRKRRAS